MPVSGLHHINFRAPSATIEALRRFYIDVLGLEEGMRPAFGSQGYWLYAGSHPVVHLSLPRGPAAEGGRGTIDHVAFACEDLDAMRARLDARGIDYRVAQVPAVKQIQVFLNDPAGNGVELNFRDE